MELTAQTELYTTIGTLVIVGISIIGFVIKFTSLKDRLEYRLQSAEDVNCVQKQEIELLKTKSNNNDVSLMEIKTKLISIEALLVEMKQQIKQK